VSLTVPVVFFLTIFPRMLDPKHGFVEKVRLRIPANAPMVNKRAVHGNAPT